MPKLLSAILLFSLLLPQVVVFAQSTCPALINEALSRVGTACANLERNSACYGYSAVEAVLSETLPDDMFSEPGDRVDLSQVVMLRPSVANTSNAEYGVSVLNVQANLPNTLPGQGVKFILVGGQEIENGVEPEDALTPSEVSVDATTVAEAQLRPTMDGATDLETYVTVPLGATVVLDAVSDDGQQVRAVYSGQGGWMDRTAISPEVDLSALPSIGPDDMTPMQAFYLPVREGSSTLCAEAPSMLVIQGPSDHIVDVQVYDMTIRIESSIILRIVGSGASARLELIVLYGLATIFPGTPQAILVPPGFVTSILLSDTPTSLGLEGDEDERAPVGTWSAPRVLTRAELDLLSLVETLPVNIMNYALVTPQLVIPSGVGQVIPRLIFANPRALAAVTRACQQGRIPEDICDLLLGP